MDLSSTAQGIYVSRVHTGLFIFLRGGHFVFRNRRVARTGLYVSRFANRKNDEPHHPRSEVDRSLKTDILTKNTGKSFQSAAAEHCDFSKQPKEIYFREHRTQQLYHRGENVFILQRREKRKCRRFLGAAVENVDTNKAVLLPNVPHWGA